MNLIKKIKKWHFRRKLMKAIEKAENMYKTTRYHYLVLNFGGNLRVIARKSVKDLITRRYFKKGTTLNDIEKTALYKTY